MFIHNTADVQCKQVGEGTQVWQNSIILPEAKVGENCNINAFCFIENNVVIGNNVTLKCGVYLWDGIHVEDDVFVGPNVTFVNDKYPRSKQHPVQYLGVHLKKGVSIGANATIMGDIVIEENAMVGAGSVVTKSIPPNELWIGSPAKFYKLVEH
jgi:UDP-2-acetamido-3-amino-2,3-dideoxy-glucuronate N-acetyltransferase